MNISSSPSLLSKDVFRFQVDKCLVQVSSELRQMEDGLLLLEADNKFFVSQEKVLHMDLQNLQTQLEENTLSLSDLKKNILFLQQQSALLSDVRMFLSEKDFSIMSFSPRFFTFKISDFMCLLKIDESELNRLVCKSSNGFTICFDENHYFFLKDSTGNLLFCPDPFRIDEISQIFVRFPIDSFSS